MVRFYLAEFIKAGPEAWYNDTTTLVFVEGYCGPLIKKEEHLALQLNDYFIHRYGDVMNKFGKVCRRLFKFPPPSKILSNTENIFIVEGKVEYNHKTEQNWGIGANRLFSHMMFFDEPFEKELLKYGNIPIRIEGGITAHDKII